VPVLVPDPVPVAVPVLVPAVAGVSVPVPALAAEAAAVALGLTSPSSLPVAGAVPAPVPVPVPVPEPVAAGAPGAEGSVEMGSAEDWEEEGVRFLGGRGWGLLVILLWFLRSQRLPLPLFLRLLLLLLLLLSSRPFLRLTLRPSLCFLSLLLLLPLLLLPLLRCQPGMRLLFPAALLQGFNSQWVPSDIPPRTPEAASGGGGLRRSLPLTVTGTHASCRRGVPVAQPVTCD